MPIVNMDDQYPINRKVAGLSDAAFRLNTCAIFWCFRNATDGIIPAEDLRQVCPSLSKPEKAVEECTHRGTWHDARHPCDHADCPAPVDVDGWAVHDYLEWQPSKDEAAGLRASKSDGAALGNHRRWHADRGIAKPGCPYCPSAPPPRTDSHMSSDHRSDHRSSSDQSSCSGPNPTRADLSLSLSVSDPSSVVDQGQVADTRASDDDPILRATITAVRERTGVTLTAIAAHAVAADILTGRKPRNRAAYIRRAVMADANPAARFLPAPPTDPRPPWCGDRECNQTTRMREKPDGTPYKCPDCGGTTPERRASA